MKKILYPFKYLYWSTRIIAEYVYSDISTWRDIVKHYYILIFISLLVLPWIHRSITISLFADILTYVSFVILLKDKYESKTIRSIELQKMYELLRMDIDSIIEYLQKYKIIFQDNNCISYFENEIRLYRDFNHFEDSHYKIIISIIEYLTKSHYDKDTLFCIKYLIFSDLHIRYRNKYIDEFFDKRHITKNKSKEYLLLSVLNEKYETNKIILGSTALHLSSERAEQIASIEFGEKINKKNIDIVIQDNIKFKKFKDLITDAISKGLISDKSLDSITGHANKLFIVIKYGEGRSVESWPENEKAPLGQLLKENKFSQPFEKDNFTFIRDLNKYPFNDTPSVFMKSILDKLNINYKVLKRKYPTSEVIQTGPHYEIISFLIDRKSVNWFISDTRNFNFFMSQILLDDVLLGEYSEEFIRTNYYKIKKIISEIEWFSLLSNDDLIADIKYHIKEINNEFNQLGIILNNIYSYIQLDGDSQVKISNILYKLFKTKKYSSARTKKNKIKYFKTLLAKLRNISKMYIDLLNDFTK